MKYQILVKDAGGKPAPNMYGQIKWDTRKDAEKELKKWFENDAANVEGLADKNEVKIQGEDGIIYTEAEIARIEELKGVEYVFPENFDKYDTGKYLYYVAEVEDDD